MFNSAYGIFAYNYLIVLIDDLGRMHYAHCVKSVQIRTEKNPYLDTFHAETHLLSKLTNPKTSSESYWFILSFKQRKNTERSSYLLSE